MSCIHPAPGFITSQTDSVARRAVRFYPLYRAFGKIRSKAAVISVGGSYDNALAKTINGLYKAEVIH